MEKKEEKREVDSSTVGMLIVSGGVK